MTTAENTPHPSAWVHPDSQTMSRVCDIAEDAIQTAANIAVRNPDMRPRLVNHMTRIISLCERIREDAS